MVKIDNSNIICVIGMMTLTGNKIDKRVKDSGLI